MVRNTKRRSARSKNKERSVWGPTAARKRATARGHRKRGEIALKRRTAMVAALLLFLGGLAAGTVVGVVADRRGLVDQAGLAPAADALASGVTVAADYALALVRSDETAPARSDASTVAAAPAQSDASTVAAAPAQSDAGTVAAAPEPTEPRAASSFEADYEPSLGPRVADIDPWKDREIADLRLTGATEAESLNLRQERIKPLPFQLLRVVVDETAAQADAAPADLRAAGAVQVADLSVGTLVEREAAVANDAAVQGDVAVEGDATTAAESDAVPIPRRAPRWSGGPTLTDLVEAVLRENARERAAMAAGRQPVQTANRRSPTIIPNPFDTVPIGEAAAAGAPAEVAPIGPDAVGKTTAAGVDVAAAQGPEHLADPAALQVPETDVIEAAPVPDVAASDLALQGAPDAAPDTVTVERTDPVAVDVAHGAAAPPADAGAVTADVAVDADPETTTPVAAGAPVPEPSTAVVAKELAPKTVTAVVVDEAATKTVPTVVVDEAATKTVPTVVVGESASETVPTVVVGESASETATVVFAEEPASEISTAPAVDTSEPSEVVAADATVPETVAIATVSGPEEVAAASAPMTVAAADTGPPETVDATETWTGDVAASFERKAADNARVMATLALADDGAATENGTATENGGVTEHGAAVPQPLAPDVPPSVIHLIYQEPVEELLSAQPPSEREVERVIQQAGLTTGVPDHATNGGPQWLQNAVRGYGARNRPMIALVIDDLGLNRPKTREAIALPAPMTLSFLTYAENLDLMVSQARSAGHEIMVHLPMEPRDKKYDPGPGALRVGMSPGELAARIDWGLSRFDGYVGVNNHMGSKLTSSLPEMAMVIKVVKERGLLFLDSLTAGSSVAERLAARMAVPYAERDLFLDHGDFTYASIRHQLKSLETIAERRGYAVGIGHPHGPTLEALADWLPTLQERGFALVPISEIVRHRIEIANANGDAG